MSYAKLTAVGRLGSNPETKGDNAPCRFSIAVSRKYKNKAGEQVEDTEWLRVVAWGKLGELCQRHLSKGREVLIEARPRSYSFEKDGVTQHRTEYVADQVVFLSGGRQGQGPAGAAEDAPTHSDPVADGAGSDDIPF